MDQYCFGTGGLENKNIFIYGKINSERENSK